MATNSITVVGNLTRDPELRFTNAGKAVVSFGIAVSHRFQQNNEWQERTSFYNVTAWDQLAENAAASLHKGTRVLVSGRPEVREYQGREGDKRTSVDINADEIGPSLRWATAQIERTQRTDGGAPGAGGGQGGGYSGGGAAGGGGRQAPEPYYGGDEEPF
jgi:single-strand DNA-binding protein